MQYNLELSKAVKAIKDRKAKTVCIQLPEGLKPKAIEITDYLEKHTGAEIPIWIGTCFGACDTPNLDKEKVDLLIQWGHSEWK